jgi:hypothetical protein
MSEINSPGMILWLLLNFRSARLRAMFKFVILFISLIWASLLLISWGGAAPVLEEKPQQVVIISARS